MGVSGGDGVLVQYVETVGSLGVSGGEDGGLVNELVIEVLGVEGFSVVSAQETPAYEEHHCDYVEEDEERKREVKEKLRQALLFRIGLDD